MSLFKQTEVRAKRIDCIRFQRQLAGLLNDLAPNVIFDWIGLMETRTHNVEGSVQMSRAFSCSLGLRGRVAVPVVARAQVRDGAKRGQLLIDRVRVLIMSRLVAGDNENRGVSSLIFETRRWPVQ